MAPKAPHFWTDQMSTAGDMASLAVPLLSRRLQRLSAHYRAVQTPCVLPFHI